MFCTIRYNYTSSLYNVDLYNEMKPTTSDPAYLKNVTAHVYSAMLEADPHATWVIQGWLFQ